MATAIDRSDAVKPKPEHDNVADEVLVRVPRSVFITAPVTPATVTQHNCESLFGITPKEFLALARRGALKVNTFGRLRVAAYEDVLRVLTTYKPAVRKAKTKGDKGDDVLERLGYG